MLLSKFPYGIVIFIGDIEDFVLTYMKEDIGGVSVKMEDGLAEKNEKVGYVKRVIIKKKKHCHGSKVKKPISNKALQKLFVSCMETFKGPDTVPSTKHVQNLCHILGMIN